MEMYKLEELTTVSKLRSNIGDKFRNNAGVQNEDAVKLRIHKGREELDLVGKMHKQRHHIITSYIVEHNPFAAGQGTFLSVTAAGLEDLVEVGGVDGGGGGWMTLRVCARSGSGRAACSRSRFRPRRRPP